MFLIKKKSKINFSPLFHGVRFDRAKSFLNDEVLKPYSKYRKFKGVELRDDHPEYHNSHHYNGWCMTRDFKVSKKFGSVIFVFNRDKLKEKFKIKPRSYSFSLPSAKNFRKESEEFVIGGQINNTYNDLLSLGDKLSDKLDSVYDLLGKLSKRKGVDARIEYLKNIVSEIENKLSSDDLSINSLFFNCCDGKKITRDMIFGYYIVEDNVKKQDISALVEDDLFLGFI